MRTLLVDPGDLAADTDLVSFASHDGDDHMTMTLAVQEWDDLGRPEVLTVSVIPQRS